MSDPHVEFSNVDKEPLVDEDPPDEFGKAEAEERASNQDMLEEGLTEEYYATLPPTMLAPLYAYVLDGVPPGGFLTAVITNDLSGAITKADIANFKHLRRWVLFFHWHTPSACHGSQAHMDAWIARRAS
jgi:hypothetical protein